MPRGRPPLTAPSARDLEVVAAYRSLGTLEAAAARFGVTRQCVSQLLARYERLTGDRVPRLGNALCSDRAWADHVLWRCPGCGVSRRFRPGERVPDLCWSCYARAYKPSPRRRRLSDELIVRAVAEVPAGRATFASLALEAGYPPTAYHAFTGGVYRALVRRGDGDAIARLWPRGVPRWLRAKVGA
jgi:hypothetical protein